MPAEQTCIRADVGGELDSVLGERIMTDDYLKEWHVSLFECLTPETARSVYPSVLIAWMVSDETYDVTEREIQCVSEWVADADVHRLIRGMANDDLTVMSGVIPCMVDFFMPEFLAGRGIDADALTDEERTCLNDWMVGYDWSNFITVVTENSLVLMGGFLPGLIGCAPGPFLASMFEDTELDLDALTDEERECLEDWLTDLDWDKLIPAIYPAGFAEEDAAFGLLAETFGILACIPDLTVDDNVGSGGPDDHADDFPDATRIGVGESIDGAIDYENDVDLFELTADAGQFYEIEVALGTLDDSVLAIYDADRQQVAFKDYRDGGTASRIMWEAHAAGTYYIEVSGYDFAIGSYTLTVETLDVTDDYPNSPDFSPPSITPEQSIDGAIDYVGDVDVFEVSGDAGQYYHIDFAIVDAPAPGVYLFFIIVYDPESGQIKYKDDYGYEAPASGVFYVQVSGHDDTTGSYTLTVALQ